MVKLLILLVKLKLYSTVLVVVASASAVDAVLLLLVVCSSGTSCKTEAVSNAIRASVGLDFI